MIDVVALDSRATPIHSLLADQSLQVVMAYVGGDGKAYVGDYHATANALPIKDGCQDWSILHGEEHSGSTLVVLSRPLITSDVNDRPIFTSGFKRTILLAAFGNTDNIREYHQKNRVGAPGSG